MSRFLGKPTLRKEDPALLSGRGRYADDLPVPVGTLQAHVVRSSHAHAEIVRIDTAAALGPTRRLGGDYGRRRQKPVRSVSDCP